MLKVFNSFQLVSCFAACPYLISWLNTKPFPFSNAALATAVVAYVVMAVFIIASVVHSADKW